MAGWQQAGLPGGERRARFRRPGAECLAGPDERLALSRRPGRIRDIIAIDIPISDRNPTMPELTQASDRIWSLIRAEAADADRELLDVR